MYQRVGKNFRTATDKPPLEHCQPSLLPVDGSRASRLRPPRQRTAIGAPACFGRFVAARGQTAVTASEFGYVTAAIATFFIGRYAANPDSGVPDANSIEELKKEIAALREEISAMN